MFNAVPRQLITLVLLAISLGYAHFSNNATITPLHRFNGYDGCYPNAPLYYNNGIIFGTTAAGGNTTNYPAGWGTLYVYHLASNTFKSFHNFTLDPQSGNIPAGGLIPYNKLLYGVTTSGGPVSCGSVYTINPQTLAVTTVSLFRDKFSTHDLSIQPIGLALLANGFMYGTSLQSDSWNRSPSLFTFFPSNNTQVTTWIEPQDRSVQSAVFPHRNGKELFGYLASGDDQDVAGVLFTFNPVTTTPTLFYNFTYSPTDQTMPYDPSGLVQIENGTLYGITQYGGTYQNGTLYSININEPDSFTVLHSFNENVDGVTPVYIAYADGVLYGTTLKGGHHHLGTLFASCITITKARVSLIR